MEDNNMNPAHKVKIKVSVILNKFKHKEDRINFFRERSISFHIIFRFLLSKRNRI
jgi:hypothetical protein